MHANPSFLRRELKRIIISEQATQESRGTSEKESYPKCGTFPKEEIMGDKNKKKLTKKEEKAANHAKLMASKKGGSIAGQASNVIDISAYQNKDNKKAA